MNDGTKTTSEAEDSRHAHPREAAVGRGGLRTGRGAQPLPAPGRRPGERQRQQEPGEQRHELQQVDPGGRQEPAAAEVQDEHERGDERPHHARHAGDHLEGPGHGEELAGQEGERPEPEHRGDQHAHGAVEAPLEEVAHGEEAVRAREPVHPRRHHEAEHQAADRGRARPPPRGEPVPVAEAGRAHGRPRPDVRRQQRHEHHRAGQRAAGHEEVAGGPDAARHVEPGADHQRGVDDEQDEGGGHGPAGTGVRPAPSGRRASGARPPRSGRSCPRCSRRPRGGRRLARAGPGSAAGAGRGSST